MTEAVIAPSVTDKTSGSRWMNNVHNKASELIRTLNRETNRAGAIVIVMS